MSEITRIYCDGQHNQRTCPQHVDGLTPDNARTSATQQGWLTRGNQHYCPPCQQHGRHNQAVNR